MSSRLRLSRSAIVKGPETLDPDITAFVVDTNLLMSHLETFNLVTREGWAVIIPILHSNPLVLY